MKKDTQSDIAIVIGNNPPKKEETKLIHYLFESETKEEFEREFEGE